MAQEKITNIQLPGVDDRALWDVIFAIYGYPALLLAHRLKIFSTLAKNTCTLSEICNALNLKPRPVEAILTTATALGFLSLHEERYRLTPVTEVYLLENSPNYFGFSGI